MKVLVVVGKGLQAVGAQAGREPEFCQGFCKRLNISISCQLSMNEEYLASVRQVLGGRKQIGSSRTEGPGEAWLCIVALSRHLFTLVGPYGCEGALRKQATTRPNSVLRRTDRDKSRPH